MDATIDPKDPLKVILSGDPKEIEFFQEAYKQRLPFETDEQKAMVLAIAKKIYTKMVESSKIPLDVKESMRSDIVNRNYFNLSINCSTPFLKVWYTIMKK